MQRHAEVLILVDREHRKFRLKQREHPVVLRDQTLAENYKVIEVDDTQPPQLGLISLRPCRELGLTGPCD